VTASHRSRWVHWLYEARKRYDLSVLNYVVTANHIHLLVRDTGNQAIQKSMQLIAGRTGQEFNIRKERKGAYWEGRYHATAIDTESHLFRCLVYIDLNMVRAGVVEHPSHWVVDIMLFKTRQNVIALSIKLHYVSFPESILLRIIRKIIERG